MVTAETLVKLVPVIEIDVPTYPDVPVNDVIVGAASLTPNKKYVVVTKLPTLDTAVTVLLEISVLLTEPPKLV